MKRFTLILFCAEILAQTPLRQKSVEIWDTVKRQSFIGGTHTIYDTDGSIYSALSNNVLTLHNGAGVARVRLNADLVAGISVLQLVDGASTGVSFQYGGTGTNGTFQLYDSAGTLAASGSGGAMVSQTFGFGASAGAPSGVGFTYPGAGTANYMGVPSSAGSIGQVLGLTGLNQLGWVSGGGDMTLGTAQTATATKIWLAKQIFKNPANGIAIEGKDASDVLRFTVSPYDGTTNSTELALYNSTSSYGIRLQVLQGDGFSPARGYAMATHLGVGPSGFASRGLTYPGGPVGSQDGRGYYWSLPSSDASGCVQSNGAGVLSISTCPGGGGGVTSVGGSGIISSTGGTTPVISCPNCAGVLSFNTFSNANTFNGVSDFNNLVRLDGGVSVSGSSGWSLSCGTGEYVYQATFVNGVLTGGSCSI